MRKEKLFLPSLVPTSPHISLLFFQFSSLCFFKSKSILAKLIYSVLLISLSTSYPATPFPRQKAEYMRRRACVKFGPILRQGYILGNPYTRLEDKTISEIEYAERVSLISNELFEEILEGVIDTDLVINLKLQEEALLAKCLGRRICSECGGNYNVACIDLRGEDNSPGLYMALLFPPPKCESKLIPLALMTKKKL